MTSLMCPARMVAGCWLRYLDYAPRGLSSSNRLAGPPHVTVSGQHAKRVKGETASPLETSGLELGQFNFQHILLVKANHKISLDSRGRKTDSSFC